MKTTVTSTCDMCKKRRSIFGIMRENDEEYEDYLDHAYLCKPCWKIALRLLFGDKK